MFNILKKYLFINILLFNLNVFCQSLIDGAIILQEKISIEDDIALYLREDISKEKVLYQTFSDNLKKVFFIDNETGSQINIKNETGKSRDLNQVKFVYFSALNPFNKNQTATFRIYEVSNDLSNKLYKTYPGQLLFESSSFELQDGYVAVTISDFPVDISASEESVLWTVEYDGLDNIEKFGLLGVSSKQSVNTNRSWEKVNYTNYSSWQRLDDKLETFEFVSILTATDNIPELSIYDNLINENDPIIIDFRNGPGNTLDWIGIYNKNAFPESEAPLAWKYVSDLTNNLEEESKFSDGRISFTQKFLPKSYNVIYFKNDSFDELARKEITIIKRTIDTTPINNVILTTVKDEYSFEDEVQINFINAKKIVNGIIEIFDISVSELSEENSVDWKYLNNSKINKKNLNEGVVTFNSLKPGDYNAVMREEGNYSVLANINFKIKKQSAENWTIMIYGHADHNLTPAMIEDLLEMEQSGSDANLNILAQVDIDTNNRATKLWELKHGVGPEYFDGVTRFRIADDIDNNPLSFNSKILQRFPESLGMDDPKQLEDFINWCVTDYPADNYGLILWNHGAQFAGYGGDSNNGTLKNYDGLNTKQIRNAILNTEFTKNENKFDFISFDTCLMGGIEVIYDFHDLCDVFFACPELDYGDGWDYDSAFNLLRSNPNINILEFAQKEVEIWSKHHSNLSMDKTHKVHAAYNMDKFEEFINVFGNFSKELMNYSKLEEGITPKLRAESIHYSIVSRSNAKSQTYFIDLGYFANKFLQEDMIPGNLKITSQNLVESINNLVISKSLGTEKIDASGISIAFPNKNKHWLTKYQEKYEALNFNNDSDIKWKDFLQQYNSLANDDVIGPEFLVFGESLESANIGRSLIQDNKNTLLVSLEKLAFINIDIKSSDAFRLSASLILPSDDGKMYDYIGEVGLFKIDQTGQYEFSWPGTNPMISDDNGIEWFDLGAWYLNSESKQMLSFADYQPPNTDKKIPLFLFSQFDNKGIGKIHTILEDFGGDLPDQNLIASTPASSSIQLEEGGKLWPVYYSEVWNEDEQEWENNEFFYEDQFINISSKGVSGINLQYNLALPGNYILDIQITDYFGNISDYLDFNVTIPDIKIPDDIINNPNQLFISNFISIKDDTIDDIDLDFTVGRYKDLFSKGDDSMELEFINFIYVMWNHFEEFNLQSSSSLDNDWISIPMEDIQFEDNINTYWINPQNDSQFYRLKRN